MSDQPAAKPAKKGILDKLEAIGNGLPDPVTLFFGGTVAIFLVSWLAVEQGWLAILKDADGKVLREEAAVDLLSRDGMRWLFSGELVKTFVEFEPLGLVLAVGIGIAVGEKSGFITAALKALLVYVPRQLLTPVTFFAGVMSSAAVDAGYIVLPPLAAMIYKAVGRSPLVGIAAVFAGVASGFNANLFVTGLDPLLAGLTAEAAQLYDKGYEVSATCNLWFMWASTALLTFVGWAVTAWWVEPRLSQRSPEEGGPGGEGADLSSMSLSTEERNGLAWGLTALVITALGLWSLTFFEWGFLYDAPGTLQADGGEQLFPSWVDAIVPILILCFLIPGLAYGIRAGSIRSDRDIAKMMGDYMSMLGSYVVLAFFASIFVAAFGKSNLGTMLAIKGGTFLQEQEVSPAVMMLGFIFVTGFMNLFVGSMSAKWALLANVFVPMFMLAGVSPELTQVTYRIGDSVTNSITPLNPYVVIVLVFMQRYVKNAGIGTLVTVMIPYAIAFLIAWAILLVVWINLGIDLGPGGPLEYVMPK